MSNLAKIENQISTVENFSALFSAENERVQTEYPYFNLQEIGIKAGRKLQMVVLEYSENSFVVNNTGEVKDSIGFATLLDEKKGIEKFIYAGSKFTNLVKKLGGADSLPIKIEAEYLGKAKASNGFQFDNWKLEIVR